jgi:hypothetical protein
MIIMTYHAYDHAKRYKLDTIVVVTDDKTSIVSYGASDGRESAVQNPVSAAWSPVSAAGPRTAAPRAAHCGSAGCALRLRGPRWGRRCTRDQGDGGRAANATTANQSTVPARLPHGDHDTPAGDLDPS